MYSIVEQSFAFGKVIPVMVRVSPLIVVIYLVLPLVKKNRYNLPLFVRGSGVQNIKASKVMGMVAFVVVMCNRERATFIGLAQVVPTQEVVVPII